MGIFDHKDYRIKDTTVWPTVNAVQLNDHDSPHYKIWMYWDRPSSNRLDGIVLWTVMVNYDGGMEDTVFLPHNWQMML